MRCLRGVDAESAECTAKQNVRNRNQEMDHVALFPSQTWIRYAAPPTLTWSKRCCNTWGGGRPEWLHFQRAAHKQAGPGAQHTHTHIHTHAHTHTHTLHTQFYKMTIALYQTPVGQWSTYKAADSSAQARAWRSDMLFDSCTRKRKQLKQRPGESRAVRPERRRSTRGDRCPRRELMRRAHVSNVVCTRRKCNTKTTTTSDTMHSSLSTIIRIFTIRGAIRCSSQDMRVHEQLRSGGAGPHVQSSNGHGRRRRNLTVQGDGT